MNITKDTVASKSERTDLSVLQQFKEDIGDLGIELGTLVFLDLVDDIIFCQFLTVDSVRIHRVKRIRNIYNACDERDLIPLLAFGIALAVISFVMVAGTFVYIRKNIEMAQYLTSVYRV